MALKVWATSDNGSIEYISLLPRYIEGALNVMKEGFYPHESACTAVGLPQHPEAVPELEELTGPTIPTSADNFVMYEIVSACGYRRPLRTARDGVSMIAVEKSSQKVIGAAFNKLQVKNRPEEGSYFENYAKSCKYSSSRGVVQFMIDADSACDLFEYCNVDCLLEIMFIATLPENRGKGIGRKLCEVSVEVAKKLIKGKKVKQSITGKELQLEPVPKIVSALFTGPASQKIGRALEWNIAARISYENFFHEGKTFASVLGKNIPDTTLENYRDLYSAKF